MKRALAVAACGLSLAGCASAPDWMPSFPSFSSSAPSAPAGAVVVQLESAPPGAEARASTGQTCRTPCSISVPAGDFTVSFALQGYQPQTVPVRVAGSNLGPDRGAESWSPEPPIASPNPVYAELMPAPPAAPARKKPAAPKNPKPAAAQARAKPAPMAPPPAPAPAPATAWPPPPPAR